ncbi:hypothetical protein PHYPSEUDO_003735 [Phytophthora pseudosyringae]|uniref:Uncharacterized protein n=1 Tax=Phytophthora pseudosyringae TaxID=221518 RepID=A0A8T1VPS4_9STRA|nr:hypothetical protein PHYPSEUDO_003735 [Phytophthora pseudosyringae]
MSAERALAVCMNSPKTRSCSCAASERVVEDAAIELVVEVCAQPLLQLERQARRRVDRLYELLLVVQVQVEHHVEVLVDDRVRYRDAGAAFAAVSVESHFTTSK